MRVLIIFYSATGNTEYGVYLIKRGIESVEGNTCTIVEIKSFSYDMVTQYDLIGFASPVFAFKPCLNMLDLITKLPIQNNKPCFTFATHAGMPCNTHWIWSKKLKSRGYTVIACCNMLAQGSWTTIRKPGKLEYEDQPSQTTQNSVIAFGKKINSVFQTFKERGKTDTELKFKPHILHFVSYFYNHFILDKFFITKVDESKCVKCGLCVKNCPSGRMDFDKFPNPKGSCIGCYKCINLCPQNAIEGWFTKGKLRYRGLNDHIKIYNPDI